ncbi:MAG: hypothetical protein EBZ48_15300, partial [Proteobacteria bacterium]|nr:hypothetical protein [Pseudomonadota bacterium]
MVRINATGACTLNDTSQILTNGLLETGGWGDASAGGSIKLLCSTIGGTSTGVSGVVLGASGGSWASLAGGGGGRIALITTANTGTAAFSGSFTYPNNSTQMSTFLGYVRARGGVGNGSSRGNGGAGTIFLQHSGSPHGDLIISNGGTAHSSFGGVTSLVSLSATLGAPLSQNTGSLTLSSSIHSAFQNLYAGMRLRPDPAFNQNMDSDWSNDNVLTVLSNNGTNITTTTNSSQTVATGTTFRSIDIVDHVHFDGNAIITTQGDFYSVNGNLLNPNQSEVVLSSALFNPSSASLVQFATDTQPSLTFASGSYNYTQDIRVNHDLSLSGTTSISTTGNITLGGT